MILLYNTVSRECTHNALAETNMSQLRHRERERERERVAGGRATMNSGRKCERESDFEMNYFVFLFDDARLKRIKFERN